MWLSSKSRSHGYQETAESKEELKVQLHRGAGRDPTQLCSRLSPSSLTHKHNTRLSCFIIPTGHINTRAPRHPRCFSSNEDTESHRIHPSSLVPHDSLLTLITSPPELPVPYWSGLLLVTPAACGLVSFSRTVREN